MRKKRLRWFCYVYTRPEHVVVRKNDGNQTIIEKKKRKDKDRRILGEN